MRVRRRYEPPGRRGAEKRQAGEAGEAMPEVKRDLWVGLWLLAAVTLSVGSLVAPESTAWRAVAWIAIVVIAVASLAMTLRYCRRLYRARWGRSERI
jgi:hypothetical protein